MKKMSIEQMENVVGGDCGSTIAAGVTAVWGLGIALSSTGVGAPLGVAVSLVGLGIVAYDAITNDPCLVATRPKYDFTSGVNLNLSSGIKRMPIN